MLEFLSLALDRMHDDELMKLSGNGFAAAIMYSSGTPRSFHHIFSTKKLWLLHMSCCCARCIVLQIFLWTIYFCKIDVKKM
jgi:hypothetical protein